jgi:hypothetical protein
MQERITSYLKELLTEIEPYMLTPDEQKKAGRDMSGFIMDKLMRKKFRRRISEDTRKATAEKVIVRVKNNEPIYLVVPFGGYKHFWNPSHPEPDWAELFHFRWMTEYVEPVLAAYKPGVILEYVSEDLILPRMNNYPEEALEAYSKAFRELVAWYGKYIPDNLELRYWRVGEEHDKEAIISKVEALLPERKTAFTKLSPEKQEQEIHRSLRSVLWNGKKDLTKLTEAQKRERIIESRLIELAFYDTEGSPEFVGEYYWQDNRICVCFSFGLSHDNDEFGDLTLQSAPGSSVDHWIGRGVLKRGTDKFYGTIISQQQYKSLKGKPTVFKVEPALIDLKNYQSIEIIT